MTRKEYQIRLLNAEKDICIEGLESIRKEYYKSIQKNFSNHKCNIVFYADRSDYQEFESRYAELTKKILNLRKEI